MCAFAEAVHHVFLQQSDGCGPRSATLFMLLLIIFRYNHAQNAQTWLSLDAGELSSPSLAYLDRDVKLRCKLSVSGDKQMQSRISEESVAEALRRNLRLKSSDKTRRCRVISSPTF